MECQRLHKLVKNWYLQVQDEHMAPARMVTFMEKHLLDCEVCRVDPQVEDEVKRITAIILPPTKIRTTIETDDEDAEIAVDVDEVGADSEKTVGDEVDEEEDEERDNDGEDDEI